MRDDAPIGAKRLLSQNAPRPLQKQQIQKLGFREFDRFTNSTRALIQAGS